MSFDAVPMSGIIVEFLKLAHIFHKNHFNVYLDLGYEIKVDKNNYFKAYTYEARLYPKWVNLIKVIKKPFKDYSANLVSRINETMINYQGVTDECEKIIEYYSSYIANKLIKLWQKLNVKIVIVENGTLPENLIMTKAFYKAIPIYGKQSGLNKFVLWRDHDLMWSSEPHLNKYGTPPYPNIPKLRPSKYITYIVLHKADYIEARNWAPNARLKILRNTFNWKDSNNYQKTHTIQNIREKFRATYNIAQDDYLIARFTRIIRPKRIDRDIHLLKLLHQQFLSREKPFNVKLIIAGNLNESPVEVTYLTELISKFRLENYVTFVGELKPIINSTETNEIKTIKNLIIASDLCSFLTSFNYESFGNPISEAISLNKPYITTNYERYNHVYHEAGYRGIVFPISKNNDRQVNMCFASQVYELINDSIKSLNMVKHNSTVLQQQSISKALLATKLNQILDVNLTC